MRIEGSNKSILAPTMARICVIALLCIGFAIANAFLQTPVTHAQSQQPESPDSPNSPIETTIAAFFTAAADKRSPTPTATDTRVPTRTRAPTSTKPVPPTATKIIPTLLASPTPSSTPTSKPLHTPTPTETPLATATKLPLPGIQAYLPILLANSPCNLGLPDCFEDNNSFAKAYGPLNIGQAYVATEELQQDRYDFYTVTLTSGTRYKFNLSFERYDLDLYVQGNGPAYAVLASSAVEQNGGVEQTEFTPTITADYYVLVYTYDAQDVAVYQLQVSK